MAGNRRIGSAEKRLRKPRGSVSTVAAKTKAAARVARGDGRALNRYRFAKFFDAALSADPSLSVNDLVALMRDAIQERRADLGGLRPLSRPSVARLLQRRELLRQAGEPLSENAFRDHWGHRPKKLKHTNRVEEYLQTLFLHHPRAANDYIHEELVAYCEEIGEKAPSKSAVATARRRVDLEKLAASVFGRKAALSDASQKATIPTDYPHQIWTIDELPAPVRIKVWNHHNRKLVAVKPWVVVIVDNHTRVIPAYWVPGPGDILSDAVSYDGDDITGTFLGGCLKELAPPATRRFAGFVPGCLRMDNHGTHEDLRKLLVKHGVTVPDLPVASPFQRGMVERLVGSMKKLCYGILGHEDQYDVASLARMDPRKERTQSAARGERQLRRRLIATEDLLDIDGFRAAFDQAVEKYHARLHSVLRTTPEGRYAERLQPHRCRSGTDAIRFMDPAVLTVTAGGVEHRRKRFGIHPMIGERLHEGDQVICRCDPVRRGIFAELGAGAERRDLFLQPIDAIARTTHVGDFVRARNRRVAEYSDDATSAQRAQLEDAVGPGANARADAELETTLSERRKEWNAEAREKTKKREEQRDAQRRARGDADPVQPTSRQLKGSADQLSAARAKKKANKPVTPATPVRSGRNADDDEPAFGMASGFTSRLKRSR